MSNLLGGLLSATINPLTGLTTSTVEYLVVAGGGGGAGSQGANYGGGGGGAGGLLSAVGLAVTSGSTASRANPATTSPSPPKSWRFSVSPNRSKNSGNVSAKLSSLTPARKSPSLLPTSKLTAQ